MKNIFTKALIGTALLTVFLVGCSDILDEQPRTFYEPGYFKTEEGVKGGLTALYAHLRYIYGQAYYYGSTETGTDEYTYGSVNGGNPRPHDLDGSVVLTASNSRADVLWNEAFPAINTASGIIENAEAAGMDAALIAEARFFRAFDYFQLVQNFGGVPLDLGGGELKFNSSASRTSVRNTVPEVYTKAIFPDLLTSINDLPDGGREIGGATKTLARFYLAKAYLTYGWWLENPKNIPTYPVCDRTDPDGHNAQWYFSEAYKVAIYAIENPGKFSTSVNFGLVETFYEVNVSSNDRNKEWLLYADHTTTNYQYNGATYGYAGGSAPENFAHWLTTWNYANIKGASGTSPIRRSTTDQAYGRPWTGMVPPQEVFIPTSVNPTPIFADKTNDSRYDGTFVNVLRANQIASGATMPNANNLPISQGDPLLTFLGDETLLGSIDYPAVGAVGQSAVGAGIIAGRADYVMTPSVFGRVIYPSLWKIGPRAGNTQSGYGDDGAASARPFPITRFAELYLIAAEAAVKGGTVTGMSARDLINVVRARAGKWSYSNADNAAYTADYSAAMIAATPATITIDYILDERAREFYGEGLRWFDLVRTQTWAEKATKYTICETGSAFSHLAGATVVTRTILPTHYLRPIPTGQLDGLEMTDAEKAAYQNPGYN
jgi:hypothetical protein